MAGSNPFDKFDAPEQAQPGTPPASPPSSPATPPPPAAPVAPPTEAPPTEAPPLEPPLSTVAPPLAPVLTGQAHEQVAAAGRPLTEFGKGLVEGGIVKPLEFLGKSFTDLTGIQIAPETSADIAAKFAVDPKANTLSQLAHGIGQFVGAWSGPGKLFKGAKGLTGMLSRGALSDFLGFDAHQGRLSNLIQDFPQLRNPVTDFLAAKPGDGEAEGRFKNALEGIMVGGLADAFFRGVRALKLVTAAKTPVEQAKVLASVQPELEQAQKTVQEVLQANPTAKVISEGSATAKPKFRVPAGTGKTATTDLDQAVRDNLSLLNKSKPISDKANASFVAAVENSSGKPAGWALSDQGGYKDFVKSVRNAKTMEAETPALTNAGTPKEAPSASATPITPPPAPKIDTSVVNDADAETLIKRIASGDTTLPEGLPGGRVFNPETTAGKPISDVIHSAAAVFAKHLKTYAQEGVYPLRQMAIDAGNWVADAVDGDLGSVLAHFSSTAKTSHDLPAMVIAGKTIVQELARDLAKYGDQIAKGFDIASERALVLQKGQMLLDAAASVKGIQSQAARATVAGRVRTGADEIPALMKSLAKGGQNDAAIRDLAYKLMLTQGNPKAAIRTMRSLNTPLRIHNLIWRAGLLSHVKTHIVNTTSNFIHAAVMPVELAMGRFGRGIIHGDVGAALKGARDALDLYPGMMRSLWDSTRMAAKVITKNGGRPILDASSKVEIETALFHMQQPATAMDTIFKWANRYANVPFALLTSEDEFFKQMTYRSHIYTQLWRQARDLKLKGKAFADFVESNFDKEFSPSGHALNEEAMRYAEKATYTLPHPTGSWGQTVQMIANRHPLFQALFAPFVKTPANLMRRVWDWTPGLNLLHKEFRRALMDGSNSARQAEAIGSLSFGLMFYLGAYHLADSGMIVGGFPNRNAAANKKLAGVLPYSFVFTDPITGEVNHVQFNRIDPFASILGFAADLRSAIHAGADGATLDELVSMAGLSLANNFTSKTWMQGASQLIEAMQSPGGMLNYLKQRAGSYVPGFVQDIAFANDPIVREQRNMWDAIMARIPGLSKTLQPKVNWLTGEDITPIDGAILPAPFNVFMSGTSRGKHPAVTELARINYPSSPPPAIIGNTKLNPEEEHRFRQLMAAPPDRQSMLDAIWHVMKSPMYARYKDIDPKAYTQRYGVSDPRFDLIRHVTTQYREHAWRLMAREYPDVKAALHQLQMNRINSRYGHQDRLKSFEDILKGNQ